MLTKQRDTASAVAVVPEAVVTIVTYNSDADIERCVRSLRDHFPLLQRGTAQVHVVDNASTDSTLMILQQLYLATALP